MNKLINDINSMTNITNNSLRELLEITENCIVNEVNETILSREKLVSYDIGIGLLYITYEDDSIKYKFIPSKSLEEKVISVVNGDQSPLVTMIESSLKQRIESTYKKLI